MESWFFKKINGWFIPLAKLIKKWKEKIKINNITEAITIDTKETHKLHRYNLKIFVPSNWIPKK